MKGEYCCSMNELLSLFDDQLSVSDILASKALGEVSAAIVEQRIELGMTQKQFAQYMNVSQGMVSKWESSDYNFSIKTLAEIASKLDMNLKIHLQKDEGVQVSEAAKKVSKITSIENHFRVLKNRPDQKNGSKYVKRYIYDSDALKVMVK